VVLLKIIFKFVVLVVYLTGHQLQQMVVYLDIFINQQTIHVCSALQIQQPVVLLRYQHLV